MKHVEIQVRGVVQGVFFRKFCQEQADAYGLTGWCQNEADGSVRIIAEGPSEAVDAFVGWCYHGSPDAEVDQVELQEGDVQGFELFQIRR